MADQFDGTGHRYVVRDASVRGGEPMLEGTTTTVRDIAEHWSRGLAPEEISVCLHELTLAQVFDALSFYLDIREEIDALAAPREPPSTGIR